jgi:hypothetical protein
MTENVENLIPEHLKNLRNDLQSFRSDTGAALEEVRYRLGACAAEKLRDKEASSQAICGA